MPGAGGGPGGVPQAGCSSDEVLGELTLNKELDLFDGDVSWRGERISVSLEVDSGCEETWKQAVQAMKTMLADQERWDRDMRAFAARELTELACEWRDSADEDVPEITEERLHSPNQTEQHRDGRRRFIFRILRR